MFPAMYILTMPVGGGGGGSADYPEESDVRDGIIFGNGAYEGNLSDYRIPSNIERVRVTRTPNKTTRITIRDVTQ